MLIKFFKTVTDLCGLPQTMVSVAMTDMSLRTTSHQANFQGIAAKYIVNAIVEDIDHNLMSALNKGYTFGKSHRQDCLYQQGQSS